MAACFRRRKDPSCSQKKSQFWQSSYQQNTKYEKEQYKTKHTQKQNTYQHSKTAPPPSFTQQQQKKKKSYGGSAVRGRGGGQCGFFTSKVSSVANTRDSTFSPASNSLYSAGFIERSFETRVYTLKGYRRECTHQTPDKRSERMAPIVHWRGPVFEGVEWHVTPEGVLCYRNEDKLRCFLLSPWSLLIPTVIVWNCILGTLLSPPPSFILLCVECFVYFSVVMEFGILTRGWLLVITVKHYLELVILTIAEQL